METTRLLEQQEYCQTKKGPKKSRYAKPSTCGVLALRK
jgi:hypothetical protein